MSPPSRSVTSRPSKTSPAGGFVLRPSWGTGVIDVAPGTTPTLMVRPFRSRVGMWVARAGSPPSGSDSGVSAVGTAVVGFLSPSSQKYRSARPPPMTVVSS